MSEEVVEQQASEPTEQQVVEQEALQRYRESQQSQEEKAQGVPEGFNEDGTEKEDLIGGKFKSQEDLLAAYQELEKKAFSGKEEPKETPAPEKEQATDEPPTTNDISLFEKEYVDNGALSEASYEQLGKMGFSKEQVDAYIEGQNRYAESVKSEIYDAVGGEESYIDLIQWVSDNMDEGTIEDYNSAVNSLDKKKTLRLLSYMNYEKQKSAPTAPRRIEGEAPASGMQPFADKNEWQRAMTDRLYGKDPKYTNMVDTRYLASRKKGIL